MKTIILDTDFIINTVKNKIDIEPSLKTLCNFNFTIAIIDKTLDELKNKPLEKISKTVISKFKIIQTHKDKNVDNLILDLIKNDKNIIIATQDKKLKEKLKKEKVGIITIRQQKYLIIS